MNNKQLLGALAMDLKRVALGLHNKSYSTAGRFLSEAMERQKEVRQQELLPYMQTIIRQVGELGKLDEDRKAEYALLYSTRIQNYVLYK